MNRPRPHHKRVRHFDLPGNAHELTFSCYGRMPLLTNEGWKKLLSQSIDRAAEKQGFDLLAFVFMPDHIHLIVFPRSSTARVERLLYGIKRPFSSRVKQLLEETGSPLLGRLIVRERPGKRTFRFWQEGSGYDRNLASVETVRAAVEYVHHNPVRRGLCQSPEQWKWSSWGHYHRPEDPRDPDLPTVHGFPPGG